MMAWRLYDASKKSQAFEPTYIVSTLLAVAPITTPTPSGIAFSTAFLVKVIPTFLKTSFTATSVGPFGRHQRGSSWKLYN